MNRNEQLISILSKNDRLTFHFLAKTLLKSTFLLIFAAYSL